MITTINEYKIYLEELSNILEIQGILVINKNIAGQEEIYSKIRSLAGVTILTTDEVMEPEQQQKNRYRTKLKIKIDKYPYLNNKNEGFDYQLLLSSIRRINGVVDFIIK